jgi:hypothetical protein
MAYENINITHTNFCRGPQNGTICFVDTTNNPNLLRVRSTAGSSIVDLTLSSNITDTLVGVEYVGPVDQTGLSDGMTFFTVEKSGTTNFTIKRWSVDVSFSALDLEETEVKTSTGSYVYDIGGFAVEHYYREFLGDQEPSGAIKVSTLSKYAVGQKLYLGPSTDPDNSGAVEIVTVTGTLSDASGKYVLTTVHANDYADGDSITFYNNFYAISNTAYGGSTSRGSIYRYDPNTWIETQRTSKGIFAQVTAARWCPIAGTIGTIVSSNLVYLNPATYYSNWRSHFLDNFDADHVEMFDVYDIIFDEYTIYRLQDRIPKFDDSGVRTIHAWTNYNYQEDSILPYSKSLNIFQEQSITLGFTETITIDVQVRDQYGVGLRDITVNMYKSGDTAAEFDPLSGNLTTDINGKATIDYTTGAIYEGHTRITGRAQGGSPQATGSEYVWDGNNVISLREYVVESLTNFTIDDFEMEGSLFQKDDEFAIEYSAWLLSDFTSPGGNWIPNTEPDAVGAAQVNIWLPNLYKGPAKQLDSPTKIGSAQSPFSLWPLPDGFGWPDFAWPFCNKIQLLEDFESERRIETLYEYVIYRDQGNGIEEIYPFVKITALSGIESDLQVSQLHLSKHTHYVDGAPYDELWTYADIDQFIFIEDAVPKFWSEKNPKGTYIWLRMRPFAFDLDSSTFTMLVREVSYAGDTGYVDVTSQVALTPFDAGGGLIGLEAYIQPAEEFHHSAIVYIIIDIYDTAPDPNNIHVEYWFRIVPDYSTPYLVNLSPSREEDQVDPDTDIYFEIKDDGIGVDIDTLEVFLNSRRAHPNDLTIVKESIFHYKVTYVPPNQLYYDKRYKINVVVDDLAEFDNILKDAWYFYTRESSPAIFTDFNPRLCLRGLSRFQDVSAVVLAGGSGLDKSTIRMQVFDRDVNPSMVPVVYHYEEGQTTTSGSAPYIQNFSLDEGYYTTASSKIYVDLVDYACNVSTSGTYMKINGFNTTTSLSGITNGYRMYYNPTDDFESLEGPTVFTVHTENDCGGVREKDFYLTYGYVVGWKNSSGQPDGMDYGPGQKVVVRISAENMATCPKSDAAAFAFETKPLISKGLSASITGVALKEGLSDSLSATIYPQSTAYFYGKEFEIIVRAKDFAGNEMEPLVLRYKIEDKPD